MTICTTPDCGNETSTYLCGQCVSDLQAWVDEAHTLAPELTVTIAKQDVLRRAGNTGGGGGKAGSAAPINLDAVQLQMNLQSVARDAATYATDQHAAGIATLIQEWCKTAERLISGPEAEQVDHQANKERLRKEIPKELRPKPLVEWLKVTHGLDIKESRIRKWAERNLITRANDEGYPTYDPTTVLIQARKEAVS